MKKKIKHGFWKKNSRAVAAIVFAVGFLLGILSAPYLDSGYIGADSISPDQCPEGTYYADGNCYPVDPVPPTCQEGEGWAVGYITPMDGYFMKYPVYCPDQPVTYRCEHWNPYQNPVECPSE